jgi:V/A-type H+-transporting ATPase subunit C
MLGEEYAAIYAKVKSWLATLLRKEELEELVRMSLQEFIAFLRTRVRKIELQTDDVVQLEGLLKQEGYYFIQSGRRFLTGSTKDFMEEWSRVYEIENLKILTRSIINGKPVDFLYRLGDFNKIQLSLVKDVKTLDELQDFLSGTPYYRLALDSFPRLKEEKDSFYFEMSLDNYYARRLKKKMSSLLPADSKDVKGVLFYFLEMNRILWIYRAKFYYQLQREETAAMLPNILKVLSKNLYEELLGAESEEAFVNLLREHGFLEKEKAEGDFSLEKEVGFHLAKRARKHLGGSPFSVGVLLSFVVLHNINVKNLVLLMESKRMKVENEKLMKMLVMS